MLAGQDDEKILRGRIEVRVQELRDWVAKDTRRGQRELARGRCRVLTVLRSLRDEAQEADRVELVRGDASGRFNKPAAGRRSRS
jgi:hypothetical protein